MDVAELVTIGAKIVEIGAKLKDLRDQRDDINKDISALEKELTPLVVQHTKIIAEVCGTSMQAIVPQRPSEEYVPGHAPQAPPGSTPDLKKRIIVYLEDAEPGMSALDVANALRADPIMVRQAMADMARSGK